MKANLRTIKKPNGTSITKGNATHAAAGWSTDVSQYSCPPNLTNTGEDCTSSGTLGMLYQWSAAMNGSSIEGAQGICPANWHIPTDAEIKTLIESQGGVGCRTSAYGQQCPLAGSKLAGGSNWTTSTGGIWKDASNTIRPEFGSSGFDLQPSGYRLSDGYYYNRSSLTFLLSSTTQDPVSQPTKEFAHDFIYNTSAVDRTPAEKAYALSVRCLKN